MAASPAAAQAKRNFDIPRQDLSSALEAFGKQSGAEIVFDASDVRNRLSGPVRGQAEPVHALERILQGTGLTFQRVNASTFLVKRGGGTRTGPAYAAAETPAAAEADPEDAPDIVVTGQKRLERAQDVPISISVVGTRQLERLHASNLQDYAAYVPGLIVDTGGSAGQASITMRGLNARGDTTMVATYIDEAPLGSSNGYSAEANTSFDMMPYDLERIEVLRGPQGTLYGANSMGGLLKYVTRAPDLNDFEARAGGESFTTRGASDLGYAGRVSLNLPIVTGELAVRASLFRQDTPGFIDNAATGRKDQNTLLQQGGRVALLWKPSDQLSIKLTAITQRITSDDNAIVARDTDGSVALGPLGGDLTNTNLLREPFRKNVHFLASTLIWKLGWAEFTSATSYSRSNLLGVQDMSAIFGAALPEPGLSGLESRARLSRFTQELRLASPPGPLQWMLGLYFNDERTKASQLLTAKDMATGAGVPEFDPILSADLDSGYREIAGFANATVKVSDAFDITGGLRWARNTQRLRQTGHRNLIEPGAEGTFRGRSRDDVVTYAISPQYRLSRNAMVYARVASGYRPGGPNPILPGVPRQVDADTIVNYEAGFKGDLFDRLLHVEVSAYRIDWKNIQVEAKTEQNLSYGANGGRARSQGVEFAAVLQPAKGLTLGFNTAYTDAFLTEAVPDEGWANGARLPAAPSWTRSLTASYGFAIGGEWRGELGAGYRYIGKRRNSVEGTEQGLILSAYDAIDLQAGISSGRWNFGLYVRNLTDRRAYTNGALIATFRDYVSSVVLQPRTIGLSLDATF
ncbi:TonB-dependent receptor domain-containing protein [Sphingomonas colocasiae]|uniref:TonB-dependent receptor n=1 Tax=Sphingomonas colocasiae TaxID=1848973 RepID=A0ABS7PNR7_9SPHN|nr:TonB-dependent receptor [Sphingomonas colocasiae]MBY8822913.1 TonB-dependent receptor [Sphingomonas colocasiae]